MRRRAGDETRSNLNIKRVLEDCLIELFTNVMARCFCDDGEVTICTRFCGYCRGCLGCHINREGGRCSCVRLKPDCKHFAFNPSFKDCRCDDGKTTVCIRRCGYCGGCLGCHINRETGKCNCMNLKPDCKHFAFNPSVPDCRCDDGATTVCTRRCGYCRGCLDCHINGETGKCNCVNLKPDCCHAAFNPSFPDCCCDDGETCSCSVLCDTCDGCLECDVNLTTGECHCINLKPGCEHISKYFRNHDNPIVSTELDLQRGEQGAQQ